MNMRKYVGNMKKYRENMKKYVAFEISYIPFSLYKGPGTWENSGLSPYRLLDMEKIRTSPLVVYIGAALGH